MRGEHDPSRTGECACGGSSPHARGTRRNVKERRDPCGIIPACAGNTLTYCGDHLTDGDHPRMRGEHSCVGGQGEVFTGSSPHARGTRGSFRITRARTGIIPACAGNTPTGYHTGARRRDHPRMRGEHLSTQSMPLPMTGSSPHARGTRYFWYSLSALAGIIPACAGNTVFWNVEGSAGGDHPRMRGEHKANRIHARLFRGSSPHARGTLVTEVGGMRLFGIIPACAGNTSGRVAVCRLRGDHPRMRGEHLRELTLKRHPLGSSPHARGTHQGLRRQGGARRIIPACAGNTVFFDKCSYYTGDHPRMRGEHSETRLHQS